MGYKDEAGFGIFDGHEAIEAIQKLTFEVDEKGHGMIASTMCDHCWLDVRALIPWVELYCIEKGVLPQTLPQFAQSTPWVFEKDRRTLFPRIQCSSCGKIVRVPITQAQATKWVHEAHATGRMSAEQLRSCTQLAPSLNRQGPQGARR
jgi:hypothetical protein